MLKAGRGRQDACWNPDAEFATNAIQPGALNSIDWTMLKGFISYAHDDHVAFSELKTHLRAVERAFKIDFWADKRVGAGNYWSAKIADAIKAARIHILMFSPAFLASDYIFDHELPAINDTCAGGDLILPVVVKRCAWSAFAGVLQAAPIERGGRLVPLLDWQPRRNGYDAAREQIWSSIAAQFGAPTHSPFPWGKP